MLLDFFLTGFVGLFSGQMQALGEGTGKKRNASNLPSWLNSLGLAEKIPAALIFGAFLGLSSPGFDFWYLAWFGLLPFFVLLRSCRSLFDAGVIGLSFGFAYHLVTHRWLVDLYPLTVFQIHDWLALVAVWSLWFLESLHQSLLFLAFALLVFALPLRAGLLPHFKRPFFPFVFSVPIIYVFLQWTVAPSEPFFGLPVSQLAYSQSSQTPLMQVCSLGGCQLLEALILLVNAAAAVLVFELFPFFVAPLPERVDGLSNRGGAAVDLILVLLLVQAAGFWGEWRLRKLTEFPPYQVLPDKKVFAPPVSLAVLQADIPVRPAAMEEFTKGERLDKYKSLVQNLGVALLMAPEAAIRLEEPEGKKLFASLAGVCQYEKKEAVCGSFEVFKTSLADLVRIIGADGKSDGLYVKTRLLPFVESLPYSSLTKVIPDNLFNLLPSAKNNFLVAPSPYLLKSIWGNVGASISFELFYPELIASEVSDGAALLVNVSDLSWFHSPVLSKHLNSAAAFRAVENGRYVVVASNTGISAVINPLGVMTSSSLAGHSGNLIDRVQFLSARTHYTRMWWLWRPSYRIWWH